MGNSIFTINPLSNLTLFHILEIFFTLGYQTKLLICPNILINSALKQTLFSNNWQTNNNNICKRYFSRFKTPVSC